MELLASAGFSADKVGEVSLAEDEKGEVLGAVLNLTSTEGYGGEISFFTGNLKGRYRERNQDPFHQRDCRSRHAGHGGELLRPVCRTKARRIFPTQRQGASAEDEIDAISGATITTRAMTNGVNAGARLLPRGSCERRRDP